MNAIKRGVVARPTPAIKAWIIGMNNTVTGILSKKPDRSEVLMRIKMHIKKRFSVDALTTKDSSIAIVPLTSIQKTNIKRQIKKKTSL